jgi:hypothetical protein
MARLEELAAQRGNDVSALLVAVEKLQRYRAAIRAAGPERDQIRAQLTVGSASRPEALSAQSSHQVRSWSPSPAARG